MISKQSYNDYVQGVGNKLNRVMAKLVIPGQRNEEAVASHLVPGIIQAQKNFYFSSYGKTDVVQEMYAHFSGVESADVQASGGRGVEDITILAAVKSISAFIAFDRAMSDPETAITYNQILAINAKGGMAVGEKVFDQFNNVPGDLDLRMASATHSLTAGTAATASFGSAIVPGTIVITIVGDETATGGTLIGKDEGKDGVISWRYKSATSPAIPASGTLVTVPTAVTVNYSAGTVAYTTEADTVNTVAGVVDSLSSTSNILRVKGKVYSPATLVAESQNLILEGNLQADAYRNKAMQAQLEAGLTMDYAQMNFRQTLDLYVQYINLKLVGAVIDSGTVAMAGQPSATFIEEDISGIANATSNPAIVGYKVNAFIESLNAHLLSVCRKGATFIVTGLQGVRILASIDKVYGNFEKGPDYAAESDGFCGTFNGVPVIRHSAVDTISAAKYANFYAGYKDPSGKVGPVGIGTYLPLHTSEKALNFDNPMQFAQGLFTYVAIQSIVPELVAVGRIKYLA